MMKPYKALLAIIPALAFLTFWACVPEQEALTENYYIRDEGGRPDVIAHGGSKLLFPENTMMAFDGSVQLGADILEIDVMMTKDSVLVCHHDETIDRMSNGSGKLAYTRYEDLLEYNFAYGFEDLNGKYPFKDSNVSITKLEDVFEKYNTMTYIVEIKDKSGHGKLAGEILADMIKDRQLAKQIIVGSFHDKVLVHFYEYSEGRIPISTSQKEAVKFTITSKSFMGAVYRPEAVALQLPVKSNGLNLGTKRVINSAHKHNMAVQYWTINDKDVMEELIEKGADGIITDRPDLMWELLGEMGWEK